MRNEKTIVKKSVKNRGKMTRVVDKSDKSKIILCHTKFDSSFDISKIGVVKLVDYMGNVIALALEDSSATLLCK